MDITVENLKKHIRWYGIISHFISVRVSGDISENDRVLVNALQIKGRKKRIIYIYDNACERIDNYNTENCLWCDFKDGRCGDNHKSRINGCCADCMHQTDKGCPTKNLACKLFNCSVLKNHHGDKLLTMKDFPEFGILSWQQRYIIKYSLYCYRETAVNLITIGSFSIFTMYYAVTLPVRQLMGGIENRKY